MTRSKSKKLLTLLGLGVLLSAILSSCSPSTPSSSTDSMPEEKKVGTYDLFVGGYEWGPGVYKTELHLAEGNKVKKEDLSKDLFTASVTTTAIRDPVQREIQDVYLVDEKGDKDENLSEGSSIGLDFTFNLSSNNDGKYITVDYGGAYPFSYDYKTGHDNWDKKYEMSFGLKDGKSLSIGGEVYTSKNFKIDDLGERIVPSLQDWSEAKSNTFEDKTLYYKSYEPKKFKEDSSKNPLIIWLHGMSEGGTDPDVAILGNDVTNVTEPEIQSYFMKEGGAQGAYVLAVQTSTVWLDDGTGQMTDGSKRSIYTKSLKNTIDKYLLENTDVDTSRIYLGGCSNGGYMTINMALEYPSFFAGYFPICEAYLDAAITDEEIQNVLKDLPIWFVASANDTTIPVDKYSKPTYERLKKAGASNVHYSLFEKVVGKDSGKEIEYQGHFSWIYAFRNEVSKDQKDATNIKAPSTEDVLVQGKAVGLWQWLSTFTNK